MLSIQEHKLLIMLLAKQNQNFKILLDILRSRGILEPGDATAFAFSVVADAQSNAALLQEATLAYLGLAKEMGIEVNLGTP
jgi:hypothetical protein